METKNTARLSALIPVYVALIGGIFGIGGAFVQHVWSKTLTQSDLEKPVMTEVDAAIAKVLPSAIGWRLVDRNDVERFDINCEYRWEMGNGSFKSGSMWYAIRVSRDQIEQHIHLGGEAYAVSIKFGDKATYSGGSSGAVKRLEKRCVR